MFEQKVAIVTGGSSGIGASAAALFAKHGARVIVCSERPLDENQRVVDRIVSAGGKAKAATCDITDRSAIAKLLVDVERDYGRLDILIQSAGVCFHEPIETMPAYKIDLLFAVNAIGPISMIQAALPIMRRSGGGAIVNISSAATILGVSEFAVYAATKAAIAHFTRTLAPELRRSNIRCNSIGPGSVRTPMLGYDGDVLTPEQREGIIRREARSNSPYGNAMIEPEDIAELALFLCSTAARALQGSFVLADQGVTSAMMPPSN